MALTVPTYDWPSVASFRNRHDDLSGLESWWENPSRDALCLFGRRRVGKSWLFRAFAHGKRAVILVADRRLAVPQMARFADALEEPLGLRPQIDDVADLIRACYRLGRDARTLIVIDELPYLLPDGAARGVALTAIQRVMEEERDQSQTKLVLCGSLIAQMETLMDQSSPLHGRLVPLEIRPMTFSEARALLDPDDDAEGRIIRYSVAGGMARYLAELGQGDLRSAVCKAALDRRGPMFNDPRAVLEQELRQPATYFSILEELADGEKSLEYLAEVNKMPSKALSQYLATLQSMRLVTERLPVGAGTRARGRKFRIDDGFVRFWFRFVFPHQTSLEDGLGADDLWDGEIDKHLADHVADTFEELCIRYVRVRHGSEAPTVGSWWGNALDAERRAGRRMVEEIDVVAAQRKRLRVVGECKWTARPMGKNVLDDLRKWKIPALLQEGNLTCTAGNPRILLFSRRGFDQTLLRAASADKAVELVSVDDLVKALDGN